MEFNSSLSFIKYSIVEAVMRGDDEALLDLVNKILIVNGVNK